MLWGAFNNASSAMMAMSWDMGSISQNIANVNTTGYKRKETLFQTVLSETHAAPSTYSGRLNIFGVQTADRYHIASQGVVTPSDFWSDLAINGSGFFLVSPGDVTGAAPTTASTDDPSQVLYSRDGSFRFRSGANGENYFVTGSGHYLMGWMADDTGAISTSGTLEPVYTLPTTVMEGRATTEGMVIANLPSNAEPTPATFSVTQTITDPLGASQELTVTWQRVDGTTWTVTPSLPASVGTVTTGAITVTMDGWGNITVPTSTAQTVTIDWDDGTYGAAANSNVTVDVAQSAPDIHLEKIYLSVFDANGVEHSATLAFEKATPLGPLPAGPPPVTSLWYLHPSGGQYATPGTTNPAIELMFDAEGQLYSGSPAALSFSWTSGTPPVVSTGTVNLDLSKMTQYDGDLHIVTVEQDGYGQGTLLKSGFNEKGELQGYFTNGKTRTLFKVPIAQFVSENRLDPISGNLFRRTAEAGDLRVSAIEDAVGEPRFVPGSLENSTVDIEDEFTKMIVTQKAYSTNATVFRTADEMTVTARDLKA